MTDISAKRNLFGIDFDYLFAEWKAMLNPATFWGDIWAGLTVTLVALPLNLALAVAAGVEPGVGITTAVIAGILSSFFGGQRYSITGPSAAMAVVLLQVSHTYGLPGVWLVGTIAGILQYAAGLLRFGKLISYVPMPVVVGFTNAIGILIAFNSLANFFGIEKPVVAHAGEAAPFFGLPVIPEFIRDIAGLFWHVFVHYECNPYALFIGMLVIFIAVLAPKVTRALPAFIIAIAIASLIAYFFSFDIPRVINLGHIPRSLPLPLNLNLPWQQTNVLFTLAITIFCLGSIESLLSASVADGMTMQNKHHSDQELIGQGITNIVIPLFGGIPVSGAIVRTAVNIRAGASSRLAALAHAFILLLLGALFAAQAEQIPLSALSGVLILSGSRLIEWDATKRIFSASKAEGVVVLVTTAISVLMDLKAGVITGLLLSCGLFIKQLSAIKITPHVHDPDRRSKIRQPVPTCKFVRTFLIDGPLFFGAAERFIETIKYRENLKAIILHVEKVHIMDLTGAQTLLSMHDQLKRKNIRLVLAGLQEQPKEVLSKIEGLTKIGEANIFDSFAEAILAVDKELLQTSCKGCATSLDPDAENTVRGPHDCLLRRAILFNTGKIGDILKQRMCTRIAKHDVNSEEFERLNDERLIRIDTKEDIPAKLKCTPVGDLLLSQNMYDVGYEMSQAPSLVVGMCVDHRKTLHLPKNGAYIIRTPGANMKDQELSIALALSAGITYMALLVHNKCLMSDPFDRKPLIKRILVQEHAWSEENVEKSFDEFANTRQIGDPISFGIQEAGRLENLFKGLTVTPLLYDVYTDKLFVIKEPIPAEVKS